MTLTPGKFVWIAMTRLRIEANFGQRGDHALLTLSRRQARMMHLQALFDDVRYRHARRQRTVGVLKHDLHIAAERPHLFELETLDGVSQEHDRARGRNQARNRETNRRLAASGFADHSERCRR